MTEIHQILLLLLSPDFRFSDNGGFLAEIIQWRATKIGRGGAVDGRLGEETIHGGLTTILASPPTVTLCWGSRILALTLTETRLCVIYSPMDMLYK